MKLGVGYVPVDHIGYGRMGVELVAALGRTGVDVVDPDDPTAPAVCWMTFPSHAGAWDDGQFLTCLTMWEGDELPEAFRDSFSNYDRMVVPSLENVELFSRYHDDVVYCPLGINSDLWATRERPVVEDRFRFLISGTGARKGVDVAVAAFRKAFAGGTWDPIPELIVKGRRGEGAGGDWVSNEHLKGPSISHITHTMSAADEADLYGLAHCYVQPARGEGFGLRPLQAIAQGCPTILTDAHGHRAFSDLGIPIPARKVPAGPFIFGSAGNWWEPDVDAVADAMLDVYRNYDGHLADAKSNAYLAHLEFSWDQAARRLVGAIGPDRLAVDHTPTGVRRELTFATYPLTVARRCGGDIGGTTYRFEPDTTYIVPAEVLRVMREAGYATN